MKVFINEKEAFKSLENKQIYFLNSICPFSLTQKLCGSWCSLFYIKKPTNDKLASYIILDCKPGNKKLYIEELINNETTH